MPSLALKPSDHLLQPEMKEKIIPHSPQTSIDGFKWESKKGNSSEKKPNILVSHVKSYRQSSPNIKKPVPKNSSKTSNAHYHTDQTQLKTL